jgi:hypothetical protein
MDISNMPLLNQLVFLNLARVLIQPNYISRRPKPLRKKRILMSTGDIEDGFASEVRAYFIQSSLTNVMVQPDGIALSSD